MDTTTPTPKPARGSVIKNIYLYLVSFVALMMIIFSTADVINIGLKAFIFTKADDMSYGYYPACPVATPAGTTTSVKADPGCLSPDEQKKRDEDSRSAQRQNSLVRDISMIIVGIPVFMYHWSIVRRKDENV
jgi:hypothetical protein